LARSTDGGQTFANYAWTNDPFEASGVFSGDYSGITAYGGRVYGVWTEKPNPPVSEAADKKTDESKDEKSQPRGTVVKVGTADFSGN
jgi:hypothetical protein